jgi:glucokinase
MKPYAIGIDVGGTKIAAGLVSRDGRILYRHTLFSHCEQEPHIVIDAIEQAYRIVVEDSQVDSCDIQAVGLGFPGNTNGPAGLVLVCSNLPAWDHLPLRDIVAERIGLPVILENDANLGAVGEHRYGTGRGTRNMCYVTFSTGYGMGIIANGELYVGHMGTAGEVGHVVIDIGGPPCTCGKRGCIMAYASGIGLSRMAYERIEAGAETLLRQMAPEDGRRFAGEVIAEAACLGDETAAEILRTAGYYAGVGLSMIVQILNPELIVLGGGLIHIGATLLDPAMAAMREHIQPEVWDSVRVVPWQLGHDLGIIGAAAKVFTDAKDFFLMSLPKEARRNAGLARSITSGRTPLTPSERARLERVEGMVFDIQRYSLHDGPGLRTNVFFKGCPLQCPWCANPESQHLQPELALFARNCMACGQFEETCPVCWATGDGSGSRRELEERLSRRVALCPTGAIQRIGERRSARDVMAEVLRDAPFYEDGGGMTCSPTCARPCYAWPRPSVSRPHWRPAVTHVGRSWSACCPMWTIFSST